MNTAEKIILGGSILISIFIISYLLFVNFKANVKRNPEIYIQTTRHPLNLTQAVESGGLTITSTGSATISGEL